MTALLDRLRLDGRVCLVTGGAGPLGAAFCHALASVGASVVVADVLAEPARELADDLARRHGVPTLPVATDLSAADACTHVVEAVAAHFGALHVLVNNAALTGTSGVTGYAAPFPEQTGEAFDAAVAVNLRAPFLLAQAAAPLLSAHGHGSVVNVSSIYGLVGPNMGLYEGTAMGNPAAYAATKGGLAQLTRYLATVLAPAVRVNAVAPGGIARGQHEDFVTRYERLTPLARMGTEDDVAGLVTLLAGDAASYVTGQVIAVDGGWTAW